MTDAPISGWRGRWNRLRASARMSGLSFSVWAIIAARVSDPLLGAAAVAAAGRRARAMKKTRSGRNDRNMK